MLSGVGFLFCDLVDGISHSCGHKWDLKWDMVRLRGEGPYAGAGVLTSERRVRNLTRAYSFQADDFLKFLD